MHAFRHWTPSYLRDRLMEGWYRRRNPDLPWLTPSGVQILESWLRPQDTGLEWGSGRSTRWIGARVARLVSVEHHLGWYDRVRHELPPSVELHHRPVTDPRDANCSYVQIVDRFGDKMLDFCLVDGFTELRDACARSVMPKLKPGGLLVVDNANWFIPHLSRSPRTAKQPFSPIWADLIPRLMGWRCIWTSNGVTDTAFWIKPQDQVPSQRALSDITSAA